MTLWQTSLTCQIWVWLCDVYKDRQFSAEEIPVRNILYPPMSLQIR